MVKKIMLCLLLVSEPCFARTLKVGQGAPFPTLSAAIQAAHAGDTVSIQPGEYHDCAVLAQNGLTVEGVGRPEAVVFTGRICQRKAALVTTGSNITIRNLTLAHLRGPEGNGAGIRAEGGDLTVERVRFIDDEDGILAAPSPAATITVRDSVFERNGACNPACAHGIYVGPLALLRVERSRFFETRVAHHIKSRAARTEVVECDLADGVHGTSSYAIELPNGGALLAVGNTIQKGQYASNPVVISIGAEGVKQPPGEIRIEGNRLTLGGTESVVFVRNLTPVPATLIGNRLPEGVMALEGPGTVR